MTSVFSIVAPRLEGNDILLSSSPTYMYWSEISPGREENAVIFTETISSSLANAVTLMPDTISEADNTYAKAFDNLLCMFICMNRCSKKLYARIKATINTKTGYFRIG